MLEKEFKENKVFWHPEEYEVFDIEEQNAIKFKNKWQKAALIDWDKKQEQKDKKREMFKSQDKSWT